MKIILTDALTDCWTPALIVIIAINRISVSNKLVRVIFSYLLLSFQIVVQRNFRAHKREKVKKI